jgi:hypothetical protein
MKTYRISRVESYQVTYHVEADNEDNAIATMKEWGYGNLVPGVEEVGKFFDSVDDLNQWDVTEIK